MEECAAVVGRDLEGIVDADVAPGEHQLRAESGLFQVAEWYAAVLVGGKKLANGLGAQVWRLADGPHAAVRKRPLVRGAAA